MRFCVVWHKFCPGATSRRQGTAWGIRSGLIFTLLALAGCAKEVKPGVTYTVSIITKGQDGKATPQRPPTRVESARVQAVQQLTYEGHTLALVVRKTQYAQATFELIFPDKTIHMAQVKVGKAKDILPDEQGIGVRIEVQESH